MNKEQLKKAIQNPINLSYTEIRLIFRSHNRGSMTFKEWEVFRSKLNQNSNEENLIRRVVSDYVDASGRLRDFKDSHFFRNKIRGFANESIGSDRRPFEVIRVISGKTVEIREMNHEPIKLPKKFHVGGFSAHCSDNYSQEYSYTSDESAPIKRIRLGLQGWGKGRFNMSEAPSYFYDYNF